MMSNVKFRAAGPVLAGLFYFAAALGAHAQNAVVLENLTIPGDADTKLTLGRVDVADTNLTRDEVARLFQPNVPQTDVAALLARMTAKSVTVENIVFSHKETRMTFQPLQIEGVKQGRFARATLAGFTGEAAGEKGGRSTFTGKKLELRDGDLSAVLATAGQGKAETDHVQIRGFKWDGLDLVSVYGELPAADKGNESSVSIGPMEATMDGDCAATCSGAAEVTRVRLALPPASEAAGVLKRLGYDQLDFSVRLRSSYDGAARRLVLLENRVNEARAGTIDVTGAFENMDRDAILPVARERRLMALLGSSVSELRLSLINRQLVDSLLTYGAQARGVAPEALKAQASATAAQLLPLLLGGDPSSLDIAQSVQTFLKDPRNFTLRLKSRGAPVPLARMSAIKDPASFLALVEIQLEVNK